MSWKLVLLAALAAPLAATGQTSLGDGRLTLIDDPLQVSFQAELALAPQRLHELVVTASTTKGWRVEADQPGRLELARTFNNERHVVKVELAYDAKGYVIRYLESNNMLYGERTINGRAVRVIHKNYNAWTRDLAAGLNGVLGVSAPILAGMPLARQPGEGAQDVRPPASPLLPAVGTQWTYRYRDEKYGGNDVPFTVRVEAVDGWTVQETRSREPASSGTAVTVRAQELGFGQEIEKSGMGELAPYFLAANPGPANRLGHAPNPGRLRSSWKLRINDVSEEAVTVPAGTFQAVRIEVLGTATTFASSSSGRVRYVAWYAHDVKRYVMLRQTEWDRMGAVTSDQAVKLVEYQPK